MPKVSVRAMPRVFRWVLVPTCREGREGGRRAYAFAEAVDPFPEPDFVGGYVVVCDGCNAHEPFMGDGSDGR